ALTATSATAGIDGAAKWRQSGEQCLPPCIERAAMVPAPLLGSHRVSRPADECPYAGSTPGRPWATRQREAVWIAAPGRLTYGTVRYSAVHAFASTAHVT